MKTTKLLILASASPRRKELFEMMELDFSIQPSNFDEAETHLTPVKLAEHNAIGKAQDIADKNKDKNALIIAVDTVVAVGEHYLGKPKDAKDHLRMLKLLSGSTHQVITAIHIIDTETKKTLTASETTNVFMDEIPESEMDAYVAFGEGDDKAAGYAIQGRGALFIKKIEGDYFNVVGLPINRLHKMLQEINL